MALALVGSWGFVFVLAIAIAIALTLVGSLSVEPPPLAGSPPPLEAVRLGAMRLGARGRPAGVGQRLDQPPQLLPLLVTLTVTVTVTVAGAGAGSRG